MCAVQPLKKKFRFTLVGNSNNRVILRQASQKQSRAEKKLFGAYKKREAGNKNRLMTMRFFFLIWTDSNFLPIISFYLVKVDVTQSVCVCVWVNNRKNMSLSSLPTLARLRLFDDKRVWDTCWIIKFFFNAIYSASFWQSPGKKFSVQVAWISLL